MLVLMLGKAGREGGQKEQLPLNILAIVFYGTITPDSYCYSQVTVSKTSDFENR